ncbi:MAG TPA: type IV pilus twitching motility protein PilT [Frankiaceae bacterium]|nr:type IV pilus twitching motility protein PilT [Frankiaceae bacterium]
MDQSHNESSPESAGGQPPYAASAPFAGDFPAPVGPPVQAAGAPAGVPAGLPAMPPPAPGMGPVPGLSAPVGQPGSGFAPAPAPNGQPAGGGFVTATMPGAPPAAAPSIPAPSLPLPPSMRPPESPGLTPAGNGAPDMSKVRNTRGTEADTDLSGWDLNGLLIQVLERRCSDLHMTIGAPPTIRLNGSLMPIEGYPELTAAVLQKMLFAIITQKQRERFEEELELDFAYSVPGRARFRVNIYRQRDAIGAAFRLIPYEIKKLEELNMPPSIANFAMLPRGFVLVTGPTGSGKSTTLASLVDLANRQRRDHIMTVEDPIEFLHQHQSCLVNQREVGEDTHSFQNALKHVLRQDPDIIMVGEMRDLETISVALTAAETGHLVFATLHTQDAAQTIDRIIDVFPPHQQQQVRVQLASSLQGIVCQTLCKTADGRGRVAATEVLVATPAIRNLVREGKSHQIYSALQAGAKHGMQTMDQQLAELVLSGRISYEVGFEKCHHSEDFAHLCGPMRTRQHY